MNQEILKAQKSLAAGKLFNLAKVKLLGDDLLKAFCKLFFLRFFVSSNQ